ncbi:hypothetical protein C8054_10460, partial [Micromonospora sp. RP3T]
RDAQAAARSAATADAAAARAASYADAAQRAAAQARASALAAGKSAQEAAADALAALDAAVRLQREEQSRGGPEQSPWEVPIPGQDPPRDPPFRLGNQLLGNNLLAQAAVKLWGGQCFAGQKQMICYGVQTPNGRPITIGDYLLYPDSANELLQTVNGEAAEREALRRAGVDAGTYGPDLLEHEARHSDQWQHFSPPSFLALYFSGTALSYLLTGTDGDANPWEIGANPWKGGYWEHGKEPAQPSWLEPVAKCMLGLCW